MAGFPQFVEFRFLTIRVAGNENHDRSRSRGIAILSPLCWIDPMKVSKWFCIPVFALSLCLVGCGGSGDTTIIEGDVPSEAEQEKIDTDYDSAYEADYEDYDDGQ